MPYVGLFFVVQHHLILHKCRIDEAERAGDFYNYPRSHDKIWQKYYHRLLGHDFDYYPRGRIVYNSRSDVWLLYADPCIRDKDIAGILRDFNEYRLERAQDEHYCCHRCNPAYRDI